MRICILPVLMTSNSLSSFSSLMLPVLDFSISIFSILIYSSHSLCFALLGDYFLIYSNSQLTFSVSDLFSDSQKINCYFFDMWNLDYGSACACLRKISWWGYWWPLSLSLFSRCWFLGDLALYWFFAAPRSTCCHVKFWINQQIYVCTAENRISKSLSRSCADISCLASLRKFVFEN